MSTPAESLLETLDQISPVLLAALEQTRSSACITTADLDEPGPTIVYVNPAYCAMTGRARAEVLGCSPRLMQGPLTDRAVLDRLRRNLTAGEPFHGETVNYRADGTPFLISWNIDPVRSPEGVVTHFVATQEDVTNQIRAKNLIEATQGLDQALTAVLNSTLDRDRARQTLVDAIVAGASHIVPLGHVAAMLVDDDDATTTVSGSTSHGGHALVDATTTVQVDFAQPVSQSRGSIAVHGLTASERAFVDIDGLHRYAQRVATVSGSLFEYQRQRHAAIRLQRSLLPPSELVVPGFEIAVEYLPGAAGLEIGGDWYDAVVHNGIVTVSVGDVSGSGVDAAALMGRLRLLAGHELNRGTAVPEILSILDGVCKSASQMATLFIAQISIASGDVDSWSAGHLPPVLFGPGSAAPRYFDVAPPLGFMGRVQAKPESARLDPGDGLFLFTDGLVERRTEVVTQGIERLCASLDPTQTLPAMIDAALGAAGDQIADDVAIVAVRRNDPST